MRCTFVAVLIVAGSFRSLGAQTPAQWRQDLEYLAKTLRTVHPAPFHATNSTEFEAAVASLDADIPRLSRDAIITRVLAVVALLQDGHTHIDLEQATVYPFRLYKYEDGIFISAVRPTDAKYLGAEIIRINGRPASAVLDSVQRIAAGDNAFSRMEAVPQLIAQPEVLHGLALGEPNMVELVLRQDNREVTWSLTAVPASAEPLGLEHATNPDLPYANRGMGYWIAQDGDVLYAKFNVVQNAADSVLILGQRVKLGIGEFGRRFLALADSTNATKLVIDLRDNPGGNNALARPIVAGIARSRFNVRGRLFVITGRRTYSAAMNFTSMLEDQTKAIFVGEAPGGSPRHYGDATGFVLPNSKIKFNVSTLTWSLGVAPTDVRIVMEPDISASPRHDDVVHGIDGALDSIRRYSASSVLSDRLLAIRKEKGIDAAIAAYQQTRHSLSAPWNSDVQQLLKFASGTFDGSWDEVYKAFKFVTDAFPGSHQAWFETGRINGFNGDWSSMAFSLEKAALLQPQDDLIRRMLAAANARLQSRP